MTDNLNMLDASDMLAAALEQMDGILAGLPDTYTNTWQGDNSSTGIWNSCKIGTQQVNIYKMSDSDIEEVYRENSELYDDNGSISDLLEDEPSDNSTRIKDSHHDSNVIEGEHEDRGNDIIKEVRFSEINDSIVVQDEHIENLVKDISTDDSSFSDVYAHQYEEPNDGDSIKDERINENINVIEEQMEIGTTCSETTNVYDVLLMEKSSAKVNATNTRNDGLHLKTEENNDKGAFENDSDTKYEDVPLNSEVIPKATSFDDSDNITLDSDVVKTNLEGDIEHHVTGPQKDGADNIKDDEHAIGTNEDGTVDIENNNTEPFEDCPLDYYTISIKEDNISDDATTDESIEDRPIDYSTTSAQKDNTYVAEIFESPEVGSPNDLKDNKHVLEVNDVKVCEDNIAGTSEMKISGNDTDNLELQYGPPMNDKDATTREDNETTLDNNYTGKLEHIKLYKSMEDYAARVNAKDIFVGDIDGIMDASDDDSTGSSTATISSSSGSLEIDNSGIIELHIWEEDLESLTLDSTGE
ncbi:unnamed protein product [Owenia fusiformis]|uniref:Uncharacterized protein n=1 Tax=Owenia fusiformis TaxID=6347 RepID=A0A8S4P7C1_OWEFU|nr:unnamed protein product [Owenia fusiformis]